MAVFCERLGLLMLLAPGTGSSAVAEALLQQAGGRWLPEQDVMNEDGTLRIDHKHTTVPNLLTAGLFSEQDLSKLTVVTAVRNPFDYWVAEWHRSRAWAIVAKADPNHWSRKTPGRFWALTRAADLDFNEWILTWTLPEQKPKYHIHWAWLEGANKFIRFERLEPDLSAVLADCGHEGGLSIPRVNIGPRRNNDYRVYYSREARERVEDKNEPDLARFGYGF